MREYEFTGDKIKNYFTAYLRESIKWKRYHYLKKKEERFDMEKPLEEMRQKELGLTMETILAMQHKEELLLKEREGHYPDWNELKDQKLVNALMLLSKIERQFIYQHIFEEHSFEEIARINGILPEKVKAVYYYSIKKIRKWMGDCNDEISRDFISGKARK